MSRWMSLLSLLVIPLALVAGCSSGSPAPVPVTTVQMTTVAPTSTPVPTPNPVSSIAGDWVLTSMADHGGTNIVSISGVTINLTITQEGQISGFDGCDKYNGQFTLTGSTSADRTGIAMGPLTAPNASCFGLAQEQESSYISVLQGASAFAGDSTHLTLTDDYHNTLIYMRPAAVTTTSTVGFNVAPLR